MLQIVANELDRRKQARAAENRRTRRPLIVSFHQTRGWSISWLSDIRTAGRRRRRAQFSIAIGTESSTYSPDGDYGSQHATAIGYRSYVYGLNGIAIGYKAKSKSHCVSLGSN